MCHGTRVSEYVDRLCATRPSLSTEVEHDHSCHDASHTHQTQGGTRLVQPEHAHQGGERGARTGPHGIGQAHFQVLDRERQLIAPVGRAPGGQRRYAAADLDWIGFLLRLRETRMPIGQMQVFARLRSQGDSTVPARRALLAQHLAEVQASIQVMQQAAQVLKTKVEHYQHLERTRHDSRHE